MGKDNRVKLDDFDAEALTQSSKNKSAANIRVLLKKQREKRLKKMNQKIRTNLGLHLIKTTK
ncbi:MAG: hypothetical protein ACJAVV_000300 [Alphaproteobacteria bacterium]|jgi:hypothetical protein